MFPGEEKELNKLLIDKDMWHLVLIGRELGRENQRAPLPWKTIAAASFQPIDDRQTIYLSWLAVSSMKADVRQWNTKKTCLQEDVKEFFDGKTFSKGKGIGSTIMVAVQYICKSLVVWQPPMIYPYYNTILCQSSFQALEFYKVAMGFTEITNITKIPDTVQKKFIPSNQILPLKIIGILHDRRRPKLAPKKHIMGHIFRKALANMFNIYDENFIQLYIYYQVAYNAKGLRFIIQETLFCPMIFQIRFHINLKMKR